MIRTTVLLADAARARIFTLEEARGQAGAPTPALKEHVDLIQSGRREPIGQGLSESRPGSQRGMGSGHAVDDHRGAKQDESDRRFASEVIEELSKFCQQSEAQKLLVCAPPRFMGHLRKLASSDHALDGTPKDFVAVDISRLSAHEALEHLRKVGHIVA